VVAAEWQTRRVQQTDHRRTAGDALIDSLGIEQIAGFTAQARTWRKRSEIIENSDDFVLAAQ